MKVELLDKSIGSLYVGLRIVECKQGAFEVSNAEYELIKSICKPVEKPQEAVEEPVEKPKAKPKAKSEKKGE